LFPVRQTKEVDSCKLIPPEITPTPATSTAPAGCVIRDRHRGTISWEAADIGPQENGSPTPDVCDEKSNDASHKADSGSQMSKPFPIQWVSTRRVPLYLTRGLTNPWNSHREMKWARDGTEIEPSVGMRFLEMFQEKHSQFGMRE